MSVLWADVSEWQTRVNNNYPYDVIAIRSNDGNYRDRNFPANYSWGLNALRNGQIQCLIVYFVWRENWQETVNTHINMLGPPRNGVISMMDVETWSGAISGDQSNGLNAVYAELAQYYGNAQRVIGYGNTGDLYTLWPRRPNTLRLVIAAYGSDPSFPGKIGHQFTNGTVGGAIYISPFGYCDANVAVAGSIEGFLNDVGIAAVPFLSIGDDNMIPVDFYYFDDNWIPSPIGLNFRAALPVETAPESQVVKECWLRWVSQFGISTWKIVAWTIKAPIGEPDYRMDNWQIPPQSRSITIEGRKSASGVVPAANLICKPI